MDTERIRVVGKKVGIAVAGGLTLLGAAAGAAHLSDVPGSGAVDDAIAAGSDVVTPVAARFGLVEDCDTTAKTGEASDMFAQFDAADTSDQVNFADAGCASGPGCGT